MGVLKQEFVELLVIFVDTGRQGHLVLLGFVQLLMGYAFQLPGVAVADEDHHDRHDFVERVDELCLSSLFVFVHTDRFQHVRKVCPLGFKPVESGCLTLMLACQVGWRTENIGVAGMDFDQVVGQRKTDKLVSVQLRERSTKEPGGHGQVVAMLGVVFVAEAGRYMDAAFYGSELREQALKRNEALQSGFWRRGVVFHYRTLYSVMMRISVKPGKYAVAVSGGVDSIVLLDLLMQTPGVQLVAAHFDHGIRPDSAEDRRLVQQAARSYAVPFVYEEGKLGAGASEAAARTARYDFLERMRHQHGARAIITAHHRDDVLETAILNMLRGTGRRGLTALASTEQVVRPLLDVPKQALQAYAVAHRLRWREDATNSDERYLRNYIRHRLLARFDAPARARLLSLIATARELNQIIDGEVAALLALQPPGDSIDRPWFTSLPPEIAKEFLAAWLRQRGLGGYDRKLLERVVAAAATLRPGMSVDLKQGARLTIGRHNLALMR